MHTIRQVKLLIEQECIYLAWRAFLSHSYTNHCPSMALNRFQMHRVNLHSFSPHRILIRNVSRSKHFDPAYLCQSSKTLNGKLQSYKDFKNNRKGWKWASKNERPLNFSGFVKIVILVAGFSWVLFVYITTRSPNHDFPTRWGSSIYTKGDLLKTDTVYENEKTSKIDRLKYAAHFVERQPKELNETLEDWIHCPQSAVLMLAGPEGCGKRTLLKRHLLYRRYVRFLDMTDGQSVRESLTEALGIFEGSLIWWARRCGGWIQRIFDFNDGEFLQRVIHSSIRESEVDVPTMVIYVGNDSRQLERSLYTLMPFVKMELLRLAIITSDTEIFDHSELPYGPKILMDNMTKDEAKELIDCYDLPNQEEIIQKTDGNPGLIFEEILKHVHPEFEKKYEILSHNLCLQLKKLGLNTDVEFAWKELEEGVQNWTNEDFIVPLNYEKYQIYQKYPRWSRDQREEYYRRRQVLKKQSGSDVV